MSEKKDDLKQLADKKVERRSSRLDSLKINKKIIESPFKKMEKLHLQSWFHHGLCDVIWAALIRSSFNQSEALAVFRQILNNIKL